MKRELKNKLRKTVYSGLFTLDEDTTVNLEMIESNFFMLMRFSRVDTSEIDNMRPLMLSRRVDVEKHKNQEEVTLMGIKGKPEITMLNNKPNSIFETLPVDGEYSKNKEISAHVKLIYEMIRSKYKIISKISKQKTESDLEVHYYCDLFLSQRYYGEILLVRKI